MHRRRRMGLRIGLRMGALAVLLASANLAVAQSEVADAAMQRNNAEVRRLVQDGADVNLRQADGATALVNPAASASARPASMKAPQQSRPTTEPAGPTRRASSIAVSPQPHPTSSRLSPLWSGSA